MRNLWPVREPEPVPPVVVTEPGLEANDCAWCLGEQGIKPVDGSHGICPDHRDRMMDQYFAGREQRKAKRS